MRHHVHLTSHAQGNALEIVPHRLTKFTGSGEWEENYWTTQHISRDSGRQGTVSKSLWGKFGTDFLLCEIHNLHFRTGCKGLLNMIPRLPPNFEVRNAKGEGDCFFDSIAQGLTWLRPRNKYNVRSLRQKCEKFAKDQSKRANWLLRALDGETHIIDHYVENIKYCAEDFQIAEPPVPLKSPIWGRPEIEGRILCNIFNVKIHLIEKHTIDGCVLWVDQVIDRNGSKSINSIDYKTNDMIHIVNKGCEHFEPVIRVDDVKKSQVKKFDHPQTGIKTDNVNNSKKLHSIKTKQDLKPCGSEDHSQMHPITSSSESDPAFDSNGQIHCLATDMKMIPYPEGNVEESRDDSLRICPNSPNSSIPDQIPEDAKIDHCECNLTDISGHVPEVCHKNAAGSLKLTTQSRSQHKDGYEIRSGTSAAGGQFYEVKLLMIFLLRCLRETGDFKLGKNVKFAGDFDDIVLKYSMTHDGVETPKAVFIQAKHKDNIEHSIGLDNLLADQGNSSVIKYFRSYLEIRKNFDSKDNPLGDVKFENCDFIFYTNNKLQLDSDKYNLNTNWNKTNIGKILRSSEESIVQLISSEEIMKNLRAKVGIKQLAQVIYDFALGKMKDKDIKKENKVVSENHIPLANLVFEVKGNKSSRFQFQGEFVRADDTSSAKKLWDELLVIERTESESEITDEEFREKLKKADVNFFKTFGKFPLDLNDKEIESLATELSQIINSHKGNEIEILQHVPKDIHKLANNIVVKDDRVNDGTERVKFTEKELTGKEGEFLAKLKECTGSEIDKFSFSIRGFPRFSFPNPVDEVTEADVDEFLKKYHFFVGQSNESGLDDIIKQEISRDYEENEQNSDLIFGIVKGLVEKWWKESSHFLTKRDQYFVHAKQRIWTEINRNAVQKFGIHFAKEAIEAISKLMRNHKVLNIFPKGSSLLSVLRILQVFDDEVQWESDIFNYLTLEQLIKMQKHIMQGFHGKDFIMIEGNWTKGHLKILEDLSLAISKCDTTVIFITDEDESKIMIDEYFKGHTVCDELTLEDLSVNSQIMILEKEVQFHGKPIRLDRLTNMIGNFSKCDIDSQMIMQLINGEQIIISNEPMRFCDMDAAYARLFTEIPAQNLAEALRKNVDDKCLFLFSGIKMDDFLKFMNVAEVKEQKVITYPNEKREGMQEKFNLLCAQETSSVIYWFEVISDHFYLKHLHDPKFYTKRRLNYPEKVIVEIDVLLQKELSDTFIIKYDSGKERIESLLKDCESKYQEEFDTLCKIYKIMFADLEGEANNRFINLCEHYKSLHLLKIDESSKFTLLRSQGPCLKSNTGNNILKPDILLKGNESETIFIITGAAANKENVKSILVSYAGTRRDYFNENCKIEHILFVDKNTDTKALLKDISFHSRPVHVLTIDEHDCSKLVWLHSSNSLNGLRNYVITHSVQNSLYDEEMFSEHVKDKFAVIADDPGMGKSTTLTSLSRKLLQTNWVIRVDFRECGEAINALPSNADQFGHNLRLVSNFFSRVQSTGMNSKLAMKLFLTGLRQTAANNQMKIVLLFDAFDEINSDQQRKVCLLLKFLRNESSAIVWVTTRRNKMYELEKCLSTFATNLVELDQFEQEEFLFRFWQKRLFIFSENNADKLRKFAKQLLAISMQHLGAKILLFIGVPLHLRLLAEGYQNDALEYCKDTTNSDPKLEMLNLVEMYERFITEKYQIYFREKTRLNESSQYIVKILTKSFNKHHQYLAFQMLFPKEIALNRKCKLPSKEDESDLKSVGIIQSFGSEGNTYFTHKTFAEYFAADLLVGNLQETGQKSKSATRILLRNMFIEDNIVVRRFIDRMLSSVSAVHVAALENDMKTLVQNQNQDKTIVDKLGRTALHLAAQEGHLNIVKVLLDEGWDAAAPDKFGKTALHYATMYKHVGVIEHLTSFAADIDIYDQVFKAAIEVDHNPSYLTSNLAKFVNHLDASGKCSLFYAASNQDWSTACILILNGADISFLTDHNLQEFLKYGLLNFNSNDPPYYNQLFPVIGILLTTIPHTFNSKSVSQELCASTLFYFRLYGRDKVVKTVLDAITETSFRQSLNFLATERSSLPVNNDTVYAGFNYVMRREQDLCEARGDGVQTMSTAGTSENLGISLLHLAAENCDLNLVKKLIRNEADVNAANIWGETALDNALNSDQTPYHLDMTQVARQASTVINNMHQETKNQVTHARNENENTLIHLAIAENNLEMVQNLIRQYNRDYAAMNAKNQQGNTALHLAAEIGHYEIVKLLLQQSIIYNPTNQKGQTPSNIAEDSNHHDIVGIFTNIDNIFTAVMTNNLNVFDTIVQERCINIRDRNGKTLLHWAAYNGQHDFVAFLLKHDAQIEASDSNCCTPLHYAAQNGYLNVVNCLLKNGAQFNPQNKKGKTPMMLANSTISHLLKLIYDTFQSANDINTYDMCTYLQRLKESNEEAFNAAIHSRDKLGDTLLHIFANQINMKAVKFLLQCGAPYDARDKQLRMADMVTCNRDIENLFKYLSQLFGWRRKLIYGLNEEVVPTEVIVNARTFRGETLLHWAGRHKPFNYYRMKYLLDNGADINAADNGGMHVIEYAIIIESYDYVKFLLKKGVTIPNIAEETIEKFKQSAEKAGRQDIIVLLQSMRK